jgi:signal transduction histidine kinase
LHDIVAHSMSLIAVKATVADHVADDHPQEMRAALQVIASTSRGALTELRHALGALRTESTLLPAPRIADLDELVAAARSTGLIVSFEVSGPSETQDGVASAVFRIVQEALTNVIKHAGASRCRVSVDVGPDTVRVEITDDGSGRQPGPSRGQGLIGMRERAALFGGDLSAGPAPTGGWAVTTILRREP